MRVCFHHLHVKGNFFSKVESEDTLREISPLRIFLSLLFMLLHLILGNPQTQNHELVPRPQVKDSESRVLC